MTSYPRSIYFKDGKAVGSHSSLPYDTVKTIWLPSDHYDFLGPINIFGKTEEEIELEIKKHGT